MLPFQSDSLNITVPTVNVDTANQKTLQGQLKQTNDPWFAFLLGHYLRVSDGTNTWYFPGQPDSQASNSTVKTASISVPDISQGDDQTLSLSPSLAASFSVRLRWQKGNLRVQVKRGTTTAFDESLTDLVGKAEHLFDLLDG